MNKLAKELVRIAEELSSDGITDLELFKMVCNSYVGNGEKFVSMISDLIIMLSRFHGRLLDAVDNTVPTDAENLLHLKREAYFIGRLFDQAKESLLKGEHELNEVYNSAVYWKGRVGYWEFHGLSTSYPDEQKNAAEALRSYYLSFEGKWFNIEKNCILVFNSLDDYKSTVKGFIENNDSGSKLNRNIKMRFKKYFEMLEDLSEVLEKAYYEIKAYYYHEWSKIWPNLEKIS